MLGTMPDFLLGLLDFNSQLHEKDSSDFHVMDEAQRDKDNLPKVAKLMNGGAGICTQAV